MKHWKSLLLIALFTVAVNVTLSSCSDAEASKVAETNYEPMQTSDVYLRNLRSAGFTKTPAVTKVEYAMLRQKYKNEYDLNFIGQQELALLCKENGLILGETEYYIGEIPEDQIKVMSDNIEKLKKAPFYKDIAYYLPDGRVFTKEQYQEMESGKDKDWVSQFERIGTKIMIAAPRELFDKQGMIIVDGYKLEKGVDPIVVAVVPEGGYIELARWQ